MGYEYIKRPTYDGGNVDSVETISSSSDTLSGYGVSVVTNTPVYIPKPTVVGQRKTIVRNTSNSLVINRASTDYALQASTDPASAITIPNDTGGARILELVAVSSTKWVSTLIR